MRFVAISDTHNGPIPNFVGDCLIHAGDMTNRGTEKELTAAAEELASYPCRRIIVVPGNHDLLFEQDEAKARQIFESRGIQVLIDQGTEVGGVKVYGTPWVKKCWGAFMYDGFKVHSEPIWDKIPDDTQILVSHSPPSYILDRGPDGQHLGSPTLNQRIQVIRPTFHIFGHIHCSYGRYQNDHTTFMNVAMMSESHQPLNPPVVFHTGNPGSYEYW